MKREDGDKVENNSYSIFSPKCCKEHKNSTTKRSHMDTTGWIFENDPIVSQDKNLDPWNRQMSSTQRKIKCMKEIDQKLKHDTRQALIEEIKEVASEDNVELLMKESDTETSYSELLGGRNEEETGSLKNLKVSVKDVSPYLMLVNRLDEEEGLRSPSIEDKLKLAEDRLRISTTKFSQACEELLDGKQEDADIKNELAFLNPEKVHEAFRPKVFDPSLRPPQTLSVSEVNKKPIVGVSGTDEQNKGSKRRERKMKEIYKQGYFLPSDTWFRCEKETPKLSTEELDILNSTSTKEFLKFLKERKESPPKVLQEIQMKLEDMKDFNKPK